jgi:fluoride exporter
MAYVWVALGGALGSVLRHAVGVLSLAVFGPAFPWGTLVVNVLGSFAIGAVAASTTLNDDLRLFLAVGLCGGFTTFSAFSAQTLTLMQTGAWGAAALNVGGSVALCLLAVWIGTLAGGVLAR